MYMFDTKSNLCLSRGSQLYCKNSKFHILISDSDVFHFSQKVRAIYKNLVNMQSSMSKGYLKVHVRYQSSPLPVRSFAAVMSVITNSILSVTTVIFCQFPYIACLPSLLLCHQAIQNICYRWVPLKPDFLAA